MPSGLESILGKIGGVAGGPVGMAVNTGLQAILGVAQIIKSRKQDKEADKMQSQLVRPTYRVPQPIRDNQALAESRASQGLTDQAMAVYENNMDRQLTTSIDAILRGNGSVNSIADLHDSSQDNLSNLALLDEELRMKHTSMYLDQNERLSEELGKEFTINEWADYQDNRQAISALRGQSNANEWRGLNTVASGFANYTQANMMQNEVNGVFGQPSASAPLPARRVPVADLTTIGSAVRPNAPTYLPLVHNAPLNPSANPYLQSFQNKPVGYTQYLQNIFGR